jgi:hypothetical protein
MERQQLFIRIWCCVDKMTVYVSDPKMWEQAFNDLFSEKINPYNNFWCLSKLSFLDRFLSQMEQRYDIIDGHIWNEDFLELSLILCHRVREGVSEWVIPMAAVAERAKSDLKRKMEDGLPHVILIQFRWTGNNSLTHSLTHHRHFVNAAPDTNEQFLSFHVYLCTGWLFFQFPIIYKSFA